MNQLIERIFTNWKTTAGGLLSVAGVVFMAFNQTSPNEKWVATGTIIVAGLTGLLGKDK